MPFKNWIVIVALAFSVNAAHAVEAPDEPAMKKNKDGTPDACFTARHEKYLAEAKNLSDAGLLLMGDFLTDDFRGHNKNGVKAIFDKAFSAYKPPNFGQGGDYTQHVLWRLQNGELDGIKPKVMMLMIGGTNGSNGEPAEKILAGVKAIVECVKLKSPGTKILLLPVLPWDANPGSRRERHTAVNKLLPQLDDGKTVKFVDICPKFLAPDGTIPKEIMPDAAHLSDSGYQIGADAVAAPLKELMEAGN